jgi:hypothetical protein
METLYSIDVRTIIGYSIESFFSASPFPDVVVGQPIDLATTGPIYYVWGRVVKIEPESVGDRATLWLRTILWVDHTKPTDKDLAAWEPSIPRLAAEPAKTAG